MTFSFSTFLDRVSMTAIAILAAVPLASIIVLAHAA